MVEIYNLGDLYLIFDRELGILFLRMREIPFWAIAQAVDEIEKIQRYRWNRKNKCKIF